MTIVYEHPSGRANLPSAGSTASFWHSEPSQFLLGHHTTPELPKHADVIIVGSGITGASAARFLSEDGRSRGLNVLMLEAREACWGATGRNGGHCQPLIYESAPNVSAFELLNYQTVRSYIESNDVPCEWRSLAACHAYQSEEDFAIAVADVQALRKVDSELGKLVEIVSDKRELAKHRVPNAVGATLNVAAASLWPYKLVAWILEGLVKKADLNVQTHTPVTSLEQLCDGKWAVNTPRGIVSARHVILATNAYTSHLLPEFSGVISPVIGQMSALIPPDGSTRIQHSYGFWGKRENGILQDDYLIQRPFCEDHGTGRHGGHLMFGGGRALAPNEGLGIDDDSYISPVTAAYLRRTLNEVLDFNGPGAKSEHAVDNTEELAATHEWSGIMGFSRDWRPWVGGVPDRKGVYLAGGYSGHGMPNATLCAKAIVNVLLAVENGGDLDGVQQQLVQDAALPEQYLLTRARLEHARSLPPANRTTLDGLVGSGQRPTESDMEICRQSS